MAKGKTGGSAPMRLDRYLTEMGAGSRSQIKDAARKGRIRDPTADTVTLDGQTVSYVRMEYYMLNKPQGVVSATEDGRHRTVVELISDRKRGDLFPVGRLDIDTEGLLLITNDGELAHRLLSPKRHVDKTYLAEIEGDLPRDAVRRFAEGIVLEDGTPVMPAELKLCADGPEEGRAGQRVLLTIREGKFHQVKRMFEALGCRVTYLKRLSMGSLSLDDSLKPGEYRPLTGRELERLKSSGPAVSETEM